MSSSQPIPSICRSSQLGTPSRDERGHRTAMNLYAPLGRTEVERTRGSALSALYQVGPLG